MTHVEPAPAALSAVHYEEDPAFFHAFLDPYLKYGSGYFEPDEGNEAYEGASRRMLDLAIGQALIPRGGLVLDVGSGWGSLRRRLREVQPQTRYHHVNPSARQRAFVDDAFGPAERVFATTIEEAELAPARYDAIFLNDSICHVRDRLAVLTKLRAALKPDGRLVVQDTFFLSEELYRRHRRARATRFVQEEVFGFAEIPSIEAFTRELATAGLRPLLLEDVSTHYRRTVQAWIRRLEDLSPRVFPSRDRFLRYLHVGLGGLEYTIAQLFMALAPHDDSRSRLRRNLPAGRSARREEVADARPV